MNESETCPRCGWAHSDASLPMQIDGWPAGLPGPPELPRSALPHPVGICCSPFSIGDRLYWNCDGADDDMPPMSVFFKELVQIQSATFRLVDGSWVKEAEASPIIATVVPDKARVYPCHVELFGEVLDRELEVSITSLTPQDSWPRLEIA